MAFAEIAQRRVRTAACAAAVAMAVVTASGSTDPAPLLHQQRYSMGTMFDVLVYHESRETAAAAMRAALDEVVRLDGVLSHYSAGSELARMLRQPAGSDVRVDPALYAVLERAREFSRQSDGAFDVTIAPVLKAWSRARAEQRSPTAGELSAARRCVGFEQVQLSPPDRVRIASSCVDIDLGGIGKGYAVDRALAVLTAAGIRSALVNAGGSSIAAIGAPPGKAGWAIDASVAGVPFSLRDRALSTSQQDRSPRGAAPGPYGDIIDPAAAMPAATPLSVSVMTTSATDADALSTTLLLLPLERGARLVDRLPDAAAIWSDGAHVVRRAGRGFEPVH